MAWVILGVVAGCSAPSQRQTLLGRQHEGEAVEETFRERYAMPRAFPYAEPTTASREAALAHLEAMHQAGSPHVEFGTISATNECVWMPAGPTNVNGRITSLAVHPNGTTIFAGTVGGLWRSTDSGASWKRISDTMRPGVIGAVALHPTEPAWVYAGGGDPQYKVAALGAGPGIWRSQDGGNTWIKVTSNLLDDAVVFRIVVSSSNEVYAATSTGVWVGKDVTSGMTWGHLDGMDSPCSDIAVDFQAAGPAVYAGVYADEGAFHESHSGTVRRIWKHGAGGWTMASNGIHSGSQVIALAMAPSEPKRLYAKLEQKSDGTLLGVYRTDDGGANWVSLAGSFNNPDPLLDDSNDYTGYNCSIAVDPLHPEVVYVGGLALLRSTDSGGTWDPISMPGDENYHRGGSLHVDQHAIAFDPQNSSIVYVGNDGGLMRSTPLPAIAANAPQLWHWDNVSHGMTITEFYRIALQNEHAFVMAGGSQDNGTETTFGNRTWYPHPGCDGGYVAVDAVNRLGTYESCNGKLRRIRNPIPKAGESIVPVPWPSLPNAHEPVASDRALEGRSIALSWGGEENDRAELYITPDGKNWTRLMPSNKKLQQKSRPTAVAVARSSGFKTFYVGLRAFDPEDVSVKSGIWTARVGATDYIKSQNFPEHLSPNAIAVDPGNELRAFVAVGGHQGEAGGVYRTTDGGAHWTEISGTGTSGLPEAPATGIVLDPADPNVLYVSSIVGVFRGVLTAASGVATWAPFDQGLPEGLDVNDIAVDEEAGLLVIGTMGYGAYIRSIANTPCTQAQLAVRDNVFDRGFGTTVMDEPNPEDAVDPDKDGQFQANGAFGARVTWFTSTDIRVHKPDPDHPENDVASPDHVAFESCALPVSACPPGTIVDVPPAGGDVRVSVQVTNRGRVPITNVTVMLLWSGGVVPAPPLPTSWGITFPGGGGSGVLDETTGWHFTNQRIVSIPSIDPAVPAVATFTWTVPPGATPPFHFLALVDAAQDPLPAAARTKALLADIAPVHRQVALRSQNVLTLTPFSPQPVSPLQAISPFQLQIPGGLQGVELMISAPDRDGAEIAAIAFPPTPGLTFTTTGGDTAHILSPGQGLEFDPSLATREIHPDGIFVRGFPQIASLPFRIGFAARDGKPPRTNFLTVTVLKNGKVLGGMRWIVRAPE